ncbi:MAG: ATP-binding cassette domain-containing protein, partial [Planctomycetes bacterium]|nr:ATP-binding cassette domain-containing protein [Planctomycetota bacterium]
VSLPLIFQGIGRFERKKRAHELLERVGLDKRAGHMPSEMSGGEQQRVAIARALVNDPKLMLCDEPTGNLDTATSDQIMQILAESHRGGTTLVMVTHDPELAEKHTQRTLRMADGQFVAEVPA